MNKFQIHVLNFQVSIFTPEILFNKNSILGLMIHKYSDIFNGDTISLPVHDDAPGEIPRIILSSKDAKIKCQISKNRLDIFHNRGDDFFIDYEMDNFLKFCIEIIELYLEHTKAIIGRLAIVINKYVEHPDPQRTLAKYFCRDKWLRKAFADLSEFEIHALKKYKLDKFLVNSWVRFKTGRLKIKENEIKIIHIIQDINTLAEELKIRKYRMEDVKRFLLVTSSEHSSILNAYFPEE